MKERRSSTGSQSPTNEGAETALENIKLEDPPKGGLFGGPILRMIDGLDGERGRKSGTSSKASSPAMRNSRSNTPSTPDSGSVEDVKGSVSANQEAGDNQLRPPRVPSQKLPKKSPVLFDSYPDSTCEATSTFSVIDECIYSSKWIGDSGQDGEVMSCECKNEWGKLFFSSHSLP